MRKITFIILFQLLAVFSQAQEGSLFDFQIQKIDSTNYSFTLQLTQISNVQYIQIHFLEKGKMVMIDEASLNKKQDGKYYLYFDGVEKEVFLDHIELTLAHEFALLTESAVTVKLVDKDFKIIDSYQKIID